MMRYARRYALVDAPWSAVQQRDLEPQRGSTIARRSSAGSVREVADVVVDAQGHAMGLLGITTEKSELRGLATSAVTGLTAPEANYDDREMEV